jgi:hypothetical protein
VGLNVGDKAREHYEEIYRKNQQAREERRKERETLERINKLKELPIKKP